MKKLRRQFELFCYKNRTKGIPNLMLYITLGTALVYIMSQMAGNAFLYQLLYFDRARILRGEIWRLFTYPLTYSAGSLFLTALCLLCYYSIGRAMESIWGTFRFNLFYFTGMLMMDVYCLLFGGNASVSYLNLSLFLSYATLFPDSTFLLFFIIPVKGWIFAILDLSVTLIDMIRLSYPIFWFPYNLFPLVALANYFLFFGSDVLNVIPLSWRMKLKRKSAHKKPRGPKIVPFVVSDPVSAQPQERYTHKCTVCGRTDVSNPELEFRYCSRCKGYYCYCEEHISNHVHVE